MSLRTIDRQATLHNEYSYTVFWDAEWLEYRVKFYKAGIWMGLDVRAISKYDVLGTASCWLGEKEKELDQE